MGEVPRDRQRQVSVLTEEWLRDNGHILAANEHARQKRMARAALDRLLAEPHDHDPKDCPQCYSWIPQPMR